MYSGPAGLRSWTITGVNMKVVADTQFFPAQPGKFFIPHSLVIWATTFTTVSVNPLMVVWNGTTPAFNLDNTSFTNMVGANTVFAFLPQDGSGGSIVNVGSNALVARVTAGATATTLTFSMTLTGQLL